MNKLIFKAPLNSLSFGNVSFNLLKEMYASNMDVAIFPVGNVDVSAFKVEDSNFKLWIEDSVNNRYKKLDSDTTTLQMWHLNGSENRISKRQILYTFYELDEPTHSEIKLADFQDKIVFSSSYAQQKFNNAHFAPLGFDTDFKKTNKEYLSNKIHFGLMGKLEKRKHTEKIIKNWIKKYGNNYNYQLTCCISNPFFKKEQMESAIRGILGGKSYGNINFLPFLPKNSQVNDFLNSIDIDLGGMSGAEGWNLPSFNATCLGKWSIVLNSTSHTDWATNKNSILLDPSGKEEVYDNIFFKKGAEFNQGSIYTFDDEEFISAMEKAETMCKEENTEGKKLKDVFTYKNTLEKILQ
jgi:hypothetical protein|tara:strand:+ start:734 stop:1789 length:1056 start_codon:yes stop_codon:yes gene_type:complete